MEKIEGIMHNRRCESENTCISKTAICIVSIRCKPTKTKMYTVVTLYKRNLSTSYKMSFSIIAITFSIDVRLNV